MPGNRISKQPAKRRYNLRSSKRVGVKNDSSGPRDADSQVSNTNKEANGHKSTGEPSQASGTPVVSQASGTEIASQAGGTGMLTEAGDFEETPLSAEISRHLIAGGHILPVTDEEMEQAGFGDLTAEFREAAKNSWFLSAFVKAWDSRDWNGNPRQN